MLPLNLRPGQRGDAVIDRRPVDARHRRDHRLRPKGQDHRVRRPVSDVLGGEAGACLHRHPQGLQPPLIPGVQRVQICLERMGPGGDEAAAQLWSGFTERHRMSAKGSGAGGFHPCRAAAHHQDVFIHKHRQRGEAGRCSPGCSRCRAGCPPPVPSGPFGDSPGPPGRPGPEPRRRSAPLGWP